MQNSTADCVAHSMGKADASPQGAVEMYMWMDTVSFRHSLLLSELYSKIDIVALGSLE